MSKLRVWKRIASLGFAIFLAGSISGCVKQMDCESAKKGIRHSHEFITNDGFKTFRISEDETLYSGRSSQPLHWTNIVSEVTEDIEVMNALNLFKISDNIMELQNEIIKNVPYYQEEDITYYPTFDSDGNLNGMGISYSWRKIVKPEDPGIYRYVDYQYYGCNIGRDDKGNPCIIKSPATDDLFSLASEWPYFQLGSYCEETAVSYDPPQHTK